MAMEEEVGAMEEGLAVEVGGSVNLRRGSKF